MQVQCPLSDFADTMVFADRKDTSPAGIFIHTASSLTVRREYPENRR